MAGEALSKTASASSLTISFHKKCDKEWRKLRDKLEAQFQEDIGRLYAKALYWDLEVVVNCKTIRAHHGILQVRAPKFFSHLSSIREPASPNCRYSSAALEKASVDYLESFIRDIYVKNSIEEEELSLLRYLENILTSTKQFSGEFGGCSRNESILSPESDIYVTPKTSPSEIIEQFGIINKQSSSDQSKGNADKLLHYTGYILPLEEPTKDYKESLVSDIDCEEDLLYSSLARKNPISDRDTHASYYSIVPVDDVCREERPRHLDLKGKGFSPAFGNPGGEALERELAEQDELLKSFQSILSKEGGKSNRGQSSGKKFNTFNRGSNRLGIPVRDRSRSNDSYVKSQGLSRETPARGIIQNPSLRNRDACVSRLPVRKQPKVVNLVPSKGANEKYPVVAALNDSGEAASKSSQSLSLNLNRSCKSDSKPGTLLSNKPYSLKAGNSQNHQYGTEAEMDSLIDYHEELDRPIPSKISPYSCEEAEEDEEEFLCSACSPCSPDMEGVSSSQQDSGLDTGTSGSGGNPPPGGGATAGDPTPSDATTSSSWHCLHSVSSPLLPRDPSVPQLLSPSFVSMTSEGNGDALGILPGAECCSVAIGEDDTEAAVLSKLKSSSVSVSSGAVSDTEDVGMMEYDETDIRCEPVSSPKEVLCSSEEMSKNKEPISFSDTMTKSIEVYQTVELGAVCTETILSSQVNFGNLDQMPTSKLSNGMDKSTEEVRKFSMPKEHCHPCSNHSLPPKSNMQVLETDKFECSVASKVGCYAPAVSVGPVEEVNGLSSDVDEVHSESKISEALKSVDSEIALHNSVGDGKVTEIEAHELADSGKIIGNECLSSGICEDNASTVTQNYFIDAATLLDDSEFVSSLSTAQTLNVQETFENTNFQTNLLCLQNQGANSSEKHDSMEDNGFDVNQTSAVKVISPKELYMNGHSNESQCTTCDKVINSAHSPVLGTTAPNFKSIVEESFQQEICILQTCIETNPVVCQSENENHLLCGQGLGKMDGFEATQLDSAVENDNSKVVNCEDVSSEMEKIDAELQSVAETSDTPKPGRSCDAPISDAKTLIEGVIVGKECTMAKNDLAAASSNDSRVFNTIIHTDLLPDHMERLVAGVEQTAAPELAKKDVVTEKNEIAADVLMNEHKPEGIAMDAHPKVLEDKISVLPQRTGELVRGDTFELEPGEGRGNWFRQEHERRQGSMLFQGLQRGSSAESLNQTERRSTASSFASSDKIGIQPILQGPFCTTTVPLTQSLPPMLVHNLSMPSIPTPPNTLQRVKNHNQGSADVPLPSTTVDSIHKLFGDQQRQPGDVESASPLQRFSQRFKPAKEEDIQSPDSLNNDGPMETFVRDAVLINRISTTNTIVSMETGEEEEESGPIVEKQTDEYLEKERRDETGISVCSQVDGHSIVSDASNVDDISLSSLAVENLKRQKRTESTPIVSGGASAADFVIPVRPTDSPLTRRRSEAAPILSGGGPPPEEPKKENPGGSPRCPRRWDGTPPPLSAWVVDMSDCCKVDSSNTGPPSLTTSWSPSTPEARKRHRRRRSEGMPFTIGNRGLRAVEFSEQPADEASHSSSQNIAAGDSKELSFEREGKNAETLGSGSTEEISTEKKKPIFSMFIDIGDSCKTSGSKGKEPKRPRDLSSGMSSSWQGGLSHSRAASENVETSNKPSHLKTVESEAPRTSDSCRSGSVFMYIDASQPTKPKTEPEKDTKQDASKKEESSSVSGGQQQRAEQKGFFMFIEADPTPPVMRKPFLLKDGHLTSTPPSKRHSWNQDAPNVLDGISGATQTIRRHKRTQSLSLVGRSSSGSNVPRLFESASGEDSDHASQSASISSMSAGQVSTSVAGSSLSLVEGGLGSGSSTGELKTKVSGGRDKGALIGSSPDSMVLTYEGSSRCQTVEEDYEEKPVGMPQTKVEVTHDACADSSREEEESLSEPALNTMGGSDNSEALNSSEHEVQGKNEVKKELESSAVLSKSSRSGCHRPDTKEAIEEEAKKQFVRLSDLDKSTSIADADAAMMESSESFGGEDVMSSSGGSRRVRPVEEMSWIESKARQGGGCSGSASSRGRLLYPIGLNKGAGRSRRGRSESPGKNGSNGGGSPAPVHRDGVEEQPLSESASALSSMQSSVDRSALEGSTEETDMSSSLGGSRSAPCSRLGQDLLRMFLDEVNTDVTVEVEGHSVRAHKCILSSRCQYFAAMLSGGWVESAGNVISLQGFSYSAVHFALCHIYSGTSNIPETISIVELATLADMLGLEGLKEVIMYTLKVKYCHFFHKPCAVCAVGVLECLPLAAAYGLDEIYRKSLKWITKYFIRIWPSKAFAALPRELIDKCYHQHVVHMSVENILDTVMCCDKLLATLPNVRWAEPVFGITSQLLEASVKFIADNFSGVVLSDKFQSLGKELSWNISRLEESVAGAADMLSLEQACLSHVNISHLLSSASSPEQETHEAQWSTNFVEFLKRLETRVEGRLVRGAGRVTRCRSWTQLDPQVRRRIQEKACIVGLDHGTGGSSSRRRRMGLEEEDGGSSSGCGGSDEMGSGTVGRRGRSRHSSLLRSSEQRPSSARANSSGGSIYCTIPRSASVRAKGKDGGGGDGRNKLANGMVAVGSGPSSQSQAAAAAAALLDSKHKPTRKEKALSSSVGNVSSRTKSSSGRLQQKGQVVPVEEGKVANKKEISSSSVVVRSRKKVSQLDKEKSASTVVAKSDAKSQSAENVATRPKTWPMRVMEGKSSKSSPQLQPPASSNAAVSSSTGTPEKAGSVSSRVRISSSDSSRNSSPALRPKGAVRGGPTKSNRTFTPTPTRTTKKPDLVQQSGSPLSGSQGALTKGAVSSPRRVTVTKAAPSRPTPDSTSSRASNSPVANLRRATATTAASRAAQSTASVTPTPKRALWSRNKTTGTTQVKQNSVAAVSSPPRTTTIRGGNEVSAKKMVPGSKPRTPLTERSARPFSPKAPAIINGGANSGSPSSSLAPRKKPFSGTYTHSRTGSNVSLDKAKADIVAPSGVGERSGTFLKDEPTVLKRPENMGAEK